MKCPRCRAEIISNTMETCPYCGSPLAVPSEKNKKAERAMNHETSEIAKKIKEAIEAQKTFYKPEAAGTTKKLEKVEREIETKKYSTSDIAILFVSLALTFIVLTLTLSLLLRR